MSAHTPGPWTASGGAVFSETAVHLAGRYLVASVYGDDPECRKDAAMIDNARLIAAAPDLLEALTGLLEAADAMRGTFGCIQGRHPEEDDTHIHEKWSEDFLKEHSDAARAAIAKAEGAQS
jgi:hypothetical protein